MAVFPTHEMLARRAMASLLLLALGCGGGDAKGKRARGEKVDSADGLVVDTQVRKGPAYQPGAVSGAGTIRGRVTFAGAFPAGNCPAPAGTPRGVAWLSDIARGRPIEGEERRVEVSTARCRVEPRVQVAVAGSTLNIRNDQDFAQRFDFIRGTSDTPVLRAPFVADGQLIPNEKVLASPGIVEIRSNQDGLRGWVIVVDHPYVAPVPEAGSFELGEVPAGRYTLSVWTPGGIVEQQVQVAAGAATDVTIAAK